MTAAPRPSLSGATPQTRRASLFWRLLPSYLVVILVAAATTFLIAEPFSHYFLRHAMAGMMSAHPGAPMQGMAGGMIGDLDNAYQHALTQSLSWGAIASLVAATLVGLYVTRRIVAPLRALAHASRRIARGSYRNRLQLTAPGEVGDLTEAFNTMAAALEHSEASRVQLLADVAHEFRTPLSNLRGYVEGIEDGVFKPEQDVLLACRRNLDRLDHLVADLSLLSLVETGQVPLAPEATAATELLERAATTIRPQFLRKGVTLHVTPAPADLQVHADPDRTEQVLTNLLKNALRHTQEGGAVELRAAPSDHHAARFDVIDSGSGIDPADLPHIFRRFYRGDRSRRADPTTGSGIGLTIARELIERQHGDIGVTSALGEGADFWFTLPLVPSGTDSA